MAAGIKLSDKTVSGSMAATDYVAALVGGLVRKVLPATLFNQPTVDASFKRLAFKGTDETVVTAAITATVLTIDLSAGTIFDVASNANIATLTISNAPSGGASFMMRLTANGTGYTQSWTSVKWPGGLAPALSTVNGAIDILSFVKIGSTWYGFNGGQAFA